MKSVPHFIFVHIHLYIKVENLRFSSFLYFVFYFRFLVRRTLVRLSLVSRKFPLKILSPLAFRSALRGVNKNKVLLHLGKTKTERRFR